MVAATEDETETDAIPIPIAKSNQKTLAHCRPIICHISNFPFRGVV